MPSSTLWDESDATVQCPTLCALSVCQDGHWHCAQALCPAECAVGGDGHYFTFDGRSFSFRGNPGCHYSLVQVSREPISGRGSCQSGGPHRGVLRGEDWKQVIKAIGETYSP